MVNLSIKETELLESIISKDILYRQTKLVNMLLEECIYSYAEMTNLYINKDKEILEAQNEICRLEDRIEFCNIDEIEEEYNFNRINNLVTLVEQLRYETRETKEVYEWYLVSDWLAAQLKENDEVVLENEYGVYWGRQTTGQYVIHDYIIQKIVKDTCKLMDK